LRLVNLGGI
jgi:hypothetical protein